MELAAQFAPKHLHDRIDPRLQPLAQRRNPVLDEVQSRRVAHAAVRILRVAQQLLRHFQNRANLLAVELAVLQELQVHRADGGLFDFGAAPEEERAIGRAGFAFALAQSGLELLDLIRVGLFVHRHNQAGVRVVEHGAFHELRGGVVGLSGQPRDRQRRHAAPEMKRVRQPNVNDLLW